MILNNQPLHDILIPFNFFMVQTYILVYGSVILNYGSCFASGQFQIPARYWGVFRRGTSAPIFCNLQNIQCDHKIRTTRPKGLLDPERVFVIYTLQICSAVLDLVISPCCVILDLVISPCFAILDLVVSQYYLIVDVVVSPYFAILQGVPKKNASFFCPVLSF